MQFHLKCLSNATTTSCVNYSASEVCRIDKIRCLPWQLIFENVVCSRLEVVNSDPADSDFTEAAKA